MFNLQLNRRELETLKPCPFCGSRTISINNTHTASYWMSCDDCEAETHGQAFGRHLTSEKQTIVHHQRAKASAVRAWNRRSPKQG